MAHSVHLRESEMETYRRRGISIAHGPGESLQYVNIHNTALQINHIIYPISKGC